MAEKLTEKLKGRLERGSSKYESALDGVHMESTKSRYIDNLNDLIGALAIRAGYGTGEEFEYEIRIQRKE